MTLDFGVGLIALAVIVGLMIFLYYFPLGMWIRTLAAGVPLSILSLIRMRLIGIPPGTIVTNLVRARKAGLPLTIDQLQSHLLAGGNIDNVTLAMIAAQRAQIPLEWQRAAAIDLAGRNVLEALQTSVNPKVIETPTFQGVAQNGIQLNVKARITVRSNLDRYVGGAGEPTIVARVGEGVVSAVGAAIDHKEVLEYPDRISKAVLSKGLDAGTAFEIVSIDIADVDVGKNIGAELQISQAEADRRIAQAKAAERQYAAQAGEQEQKAETQRMRARVVEAEAAVPLAVAEAFRSGNLGIMDYYRMNNIKADTEMRSAISGGVAPDQPPPSMHRPPRERHSGFDHRERRRSSRQARARRRRRRRTVGIRLPQPPVRPPTGLSPQWSSGRAISEAGRAGSRGSVRAVRGAPHRAAVALRRPAESDPHRRRDGDPRAAAGAAPAKPLGHARRLGVCDRYPREA